LFAKDRLFLSDAGTSIYTDRPEIKSELDFCAPPDKDALRDDLTFSSLGPDHFNWEVSDNRLIS
jgi:hypothetical protein